MLLHPPPQDQLVGIARLAARSEVLAAKRRVEYLELETRAFIGRCSGKRMPFVWTVNPYRGCEFGCKYCYARYAHEFMELRDPDQFETKIFIKKFNGPAFRAELRKVKPHEALWIGTATDPYQPAERSYRITRQMLETLAGERNFRIGLTTKSDLIARDVDILIKVAERNGVRINLTITTVDEDLARSLEPLAPRPALRFKALAKLAAAGLRVAVLAHPVLPLINDSEASLDAVCGAAAQAGATAFSAAPVFLKPCAQKVFFPFLEERFPHLVRRYQERFEKNAYLAGHYPEMLSERVRTLVKRHGLGPRDFDFIPEEFAREPQLNLFASDAKCCFTS